MAELEEKVIEGLVKKLGLEKEEVEQAHTTFLDKHPEGHMTRFDMLQQAALFSNQLHMPIWNCDIAFLFLSDKGKTVFQSEGPNIIFCW